MVTSIVHCLVLARMKSIAVERIKLNIVVKFLTSINQIIIFLITKFNRFYFYFSYEYKFDTLTVILAGFIFLIIAGMFINILKRLASNNNRIKNLIENLILKILLYPSYK